MTRKKFSFLVIFLCVTLILFSIGESAWVIYDHYVQEDATATYDDSAPFVCYNSDTSLNYRTLNKALEEATSGQEVIVYINSEITCSETLTVPEGVTLTIPFLGKTNNPSDTGNNISLDTTLYHLDSVENRAAYGNVLGDSNSTNVNSYRSCLIDLRNGADIEVHGTLNLGGACSTQGNNGYYSEINLGENSSITCFSRSIFNCYGFVKEQSDTARNIGMNEFANIRDNSFDSGRYIEILAGATINTQIAFYDMESGGGLTGAINANQSPFNVFDFQLLQTFTLFHSNSTLYATALVIGPNNMAMQESLCIISSNTSDPALLYLKSDTLSLEYQTTHPLYSSRSTTDNGFTININGNLDVGYLYLNAYGVMELDTRKLFLPLSSKVSIFVDNGAVFNASQKVKFLMGSKLIVCEGGTFQVNNIVAFYNSNVAPTRNPDLGINYDSTGKEDALLEVDGTLIINTDGMNQGYLGANISHSNQTGIAHLDFTQISNNSYLSAEVLEGTTNFSVVVTTAGLFMSESGTTRGQFNAGIVYDSAFSESNYYWNGEFNTTELITVEIDTTIVNPVFDYTIMLSESSDGSNAFASELIDSSAAGETSVSTGLYFNIVVNDAVSVTLHKGTGEALVYNPSSWILVDGSFNIYITPSEGVEISLSVYKDTTYNDNEGNWSAGTGHTIYTVEVSDTLDGQYTEVYNQQSAGISGLFVKKGQYFRIGYSWVEGDTVIEISGQNGFTGNNRITTNDPNFLPQPNTEWVNDTTSSTSPSFLAGDESAAPGLLYTFEMGYYSGHALADENGGGSICLLPNSVITLADGSTKLAKDLTKEDSVLTYNHFAGEFEGQKLVFNALMEKQLYDVIVLTFSNGNVLTVATGHGLFNLTKGNYEIYYGNEFYEHVGEEFAAVEKVNNEFILTPTTLIRVSVEKKEVIKVSPVSEYNINCIADGMLTIPDDIEGMLDGYQYASLRDGLTIDQKDLAMKIEKYGVFTDEDLQYFLPSYLIDVLRLKYMKTFIGMGILTYDKLNYWALKYAPSMLEYQQIEWDWSYFKPLKPE